MKSVVEFDALGTHWWITIYGSLTDTELVHALTQRVENFENNNSRFKPESLVGTLNSTKVLDNPPAEMVAMLTFARNLYAASNGVFNIAVGGELVKIGYGKGGRNTILQKNIWDSIEVSESHIAIPATCEIDFGGFGKGWLIDRLGELLEKYGRTQYIINGGGDILVHTNKPTELALEHPQNARRKIGVTRIQRGALASSSVVKRAWRSNGKKMHHIIDPRSGKPSDSPVISTFVRANSALIADVMATILIIAPELNDKLRDLYQLKTILLKGSCVRN